MVTLLAIAALIFIWTRTGVGFLTKSSLTLLIFFSGCCGACISGCG